jgi:hypothetical protein
LPGKKFVQSHRAIREQKSGNSLGVVTLKDLAIFTYLDSLICCNPMCITWQAPRLLLGRKGTFGLTHLLEHREANAKGTSLV